MESIDKASSRDSDREKMIALAFGEIVAGAGGDVIEAAHALTRWSLRLLDIGGAGVMMADDRGVLRSVVVSSDTISALEAAELDRGRGPCVESHRRARAVIHPDLDVPDARWPEFAPYARAGGMRSAHAIPMLGGGAAVGVLNLFRTSTGGLTGTDAALAQSLADAAGTAVSAPQPSNRAAIRAEDLAVAVADAATIERAKGTLAVRLQVDIDTAYAVLRRVAKDQGRAVGEVAAAVMTGRTTITLPLSVDGAQLQWPTAT